MSDLRKWTLSADGSYEGPQIGPSLARLIRGETFTDEEYEFEGVEVVEVPDRLRESLERIFLYARDSGQFDTYALLPAAQILRALGWEA